MKISIEKFELDNRVIYKFPTAKRLIDVMNGKKDVKQRIFASLTLKLEILSTSHLPIDLCQLVQSLVNRRDAGHNT